MVAKYIVSDQDWCSYLFKVPVEVVTLNNSDYLVVRWLVPTLYEINIEWPQSPQSGLQACTNSQQSFHRFAESEL
jgi:hypothetical protein